MTETNPQPRVDTTGWAMCPSDASANKAWQQIADLARAHCLIVQAYDGVMVLATPEAQRNPGNGEPIRNDVLVVHRMRETIELHGREAP